jgi:hypothetical protein
VPHQTDYDDDYDNDNDNESDSDPSSTFDEDNQVASD